MNKVLNISLATMVIFNMPLMAYDPIDAMDDDMTAKEMEERQRQEAEDQRRREEEERTEHWSEEEDGDITIWHSPRKLSVDCLSGSHRKQIFNQIVELKRQAMNNINQASSLRWNIPDISIRTIFAGIMADCITGCAYGCPAATCAACITELGSATCQKTMEFYEAQGLVRSAKALYQEAERLEEILWYDTDAEDWE